MKIMKSMAKLSNTNVPDKNYLKKRKKCYKTENIDDSTFFLNVYILTPSFTAFEQCLR